MELMDAHTHTHTPMDVYTMCNGKLVKIGVVRQCWPTHFARLASVVSGFGVRRVRFKNIIYQIMELHIMHVNKAWVPVMGWGGGKAEGVSATNGYMGRR